MRKTEGHSHIAHSLGSTVSRSMIYVRSNMKSNVEERPFRAALQEREFGALAPAVSGSRIKAP